MYYSYLVTKWFVKPQSFAVCQLPRLILRVGILLLRTSPPVRLRLNESALQGAVNVASLLLVIHAAANFFVYQVRGQGHQNQGAAEPGCRRTRVLLNH